MLNFFEWFNLYIWIKRKKQQFPTVREIGVVFEYNSLTNAPIEGIFQSV